MNALESTLSFVLNGLWRASWQATLLAMVVLVIQKLLGKRLGGRGRFALWAVVVVRLLLPVLPESRFSVFNLAKSKTQPAAVTVAPDEPRIPIIVIGPVESAKPQAAERAPALMTSTHQFHWVGWIFAAWVAGVLTLSIRVSQVCRELAHTIRKLSKVENEHLLDVVRSCAQLLHLRRIPAIVAGDTVQTPAVVGLIRPRLLLPSHVLSACNDREIRLIVLHELAHLKRHDIAGNWLIALASILHWFNPVVWLLSARMRADRELACDELVLSASSGEAQAYGRTLLKLIEILSPKVRSLAMSPRELAIVGILESTTPMKRRVRMIAQFDPNQSRRWIWTVLVLGILGAVALTDRVRGDNNASKPAPATKPDVLFADSVVTTQATAQAAATEIRAYDINDLIRNSGLDRPTEIASVSKAIKSLVEPQSWAESGGPAELQEVNGKLIIRQTDAAHQKITDLLNLLKSETSSAAAPAPIPAPPGAMGPGGMPMQPAPTMQTFPRTVVSDEQLEAANRGAVATLRMKIPEVKFDGVALSDVIDFYRDITKANIVLNWRTLEQAGIDRSAPVTIRLKDTTFENALNATLRQVDAQQLAVVVDQGVITITTIMDLPSYSVTKTYDVSDLIQIATPQGGNPRQDLAGVVQSLNPLGGISVQSFGEKLIVTALPDAQEQVQKLLADLRSGPTTRPNQ
jgi:bla regulator protein BlaR1